MALFILDVFIFSVFVGTVLGILSGLGTGGGSLLILWLTLVHNMPPADAKAINLMFFIPSALIACFFRWKQGSINIKKVLPAIITGSIFAAIFAWFGNQMDTNLLRKAFGFLLIFTGIKELLYKKKKQQNT